MALAEVPFDLVEVKLAAPSARPGTVAKADAIARLCTSTLPFATVVAPAGYGKTTLLAKWADADPRPVRVGRTRRPGRRRCGVPALHRSRDSRRRAGSGRGVRGVVGSGGSTWSNRVPRVGSALGALERPLVLVLDDLHTVTNPSCLDVLAALFEYVPAGSQIAVASREGPALPLARWRAHGLVHEIGVRGPPAGRAGGQAAARSGRSRARRERAVRPDRADGRLAGGPIPRGAVDAGRRAEPGERRRIQPAATGSCPSTSASSCCPGCRRPRRSFSSTPRCSIACAAGFATP